ncbi:ABC transporter permease [Streptoalloteichus hindustanus]|uniref:Nucleoside ABC transporter membrane protein n=1 Tax=Streptoalloteichus hindustanus TaxID=2017 RepID=A0A1M5KBN1_STRHI|nr:ABC transporter permease [Streptoalloteichus hindustanus]SHG50101.1 nucleoside ABC transporter membrane protein [Streptoalloteichus hindustanus]
MGTLRGRLLPPVLAIAFSALLCTVTLMVSGANPASGIAAMVTQVGEGSVAVDIVNSAAVYYLAALAVAIGFQMNLFNIGVEGQFRVAAVTAAIVGAAIDLPAGLHAVVVILTAAVTGALYAAIPALLKITRNVHEVISSIMLNAIAAGVIALLIREDMFGELRGSNIGTHTIPESGWVGGIGFGDRGTLFGLVFLVLVIGVGYWVMMNRTRFGFELRASGESPTAAAAGGVNARRMILVAMLMSGAVAGLVAMPELLGRDHTYLITSPAGYGFTGIAIALLGRNHPGGIALGALLWAFLDKSSLALDNVGVPKEIVTIMQGSIVLSVVIAYEVVRRVELRAERRRVGRQLGANGGGTGNGGATPAAATAGGAS